MLRFCEKDGTLLVVKRRGKNAYLVCPKCGKRYSLKGEKLTITEKMGEKKREIVVIGKDETLRELPTTKIMCPKCGNMEAYWWMQQTRGADEPPTIFYRCTKCGYSWRSYD